MHNYIHRSINIPNRKTIEPMSMVCENRCGHLHVLQTEIIIIIIIIIIKTISLQDLITIDTFWLFFQYECCGIDTSIDFKDKSASWDRTPGIITTHIDAPLICCKTPITGSTDGDVDCARDGVTKDIYPEVVYLYYLSGGCIPILSIRRLYTYIIYLEVVYLYYFS